MSDPKRSLVLATLLLGACPARPDVSSSDTSGSSSTSDSDSSSSSESESETGSTTDDPSPRPARLLLTSDWLGKRLSLLDYAALRDGATAREQALWRTIELPDHEPGPLEAELGPDGNLIVASIAPGFFAGAGGALAGAGTVPEGGALLIIEVESGTILAELETASYPMGLAFSEDGGEVWTANYGGNGQSGTSVSRIDLTSLTIVEELEVGPGPEQLDISGSLALVNTAGDGAVRMFELADPLATLSPPLVTSSDSSWVLQLPVADRAVVINSLGPPGYSLLDTQDPLAPTVLDTIEVVGIPYAGTFGFEANQILLTAITGTSVAVELFDTSTGEQLEQLEIPALGFPLGIAADPIDRVVFVPVAGANVLAVVDFIAQEVRMLDWQDVSGPTYVALEP